MKLYVPREASFPFSLKFLDVTRATNTSLDVMLEKDIDNCWNVDGNRELSDTWTGFTRFFVLDEKHHLDVHGPGRRLTGKQTTSRPDTLWPEISTDMSDASKRKEKQQWAIEKPKLRKLRGIYFIVPGDEEFKDSSKYRGVVQALNKDSEVQRTMKRTDICASYLASSK